MPTHDRVAELSEHSALTHWRGEGSEITRTHQFFHYFSRTLEVEVWTLETPIQPSLLIDPKSLQIVENASFVRASLSAYPSF